MLLCAFPPLPTPPLLTLLTQAESDRGRVSVISEERSGGNTTVKQLIAKQSSGNERGVLNS